jgi:hypothetical protein
VKTTEKISWSNLHGPMNREGLTIGFSQEIASEKEKPVHH